MLPPNRRWRNGYGGGRWRRSGTMGWVVSEQSGEVEWPLVSRSDDAGEDLLGVGAAARRQVREDRGAGASRGRQPTEGPVEQQGDDFAPSTRPRRRAVSSLSTWLPTRRGRQQVASTVSHSSAVRPRAWPRPADALERLLGQCAVRRQLARAARGQCRWVAEARRPR